MLSDVVEMYFGQGIQYETNRKLDIPPSEIMEIITPSMIQKYSYEQFISKLKEKVHGIGEEPAGEEPTVPPRPPLP